MLPADLAGQIGEQQGQFDVFKGGEHRDQLVELEDEADVVGPPVGQLGLGEPGQIDALHQ